MTKSPTTLAVVAGLLLAGPVLAVEIAVGTKAFTESVILGEMLAALARDTGAKVELRAELGGTQIVWQALKSGEIDAYVDYTGTVAYELLPGRGISSHDEEGLRKALAEQGIVMGRPLGFANSYGLAMKESTAADLRIEKISDLKKHPALKIGLSDEFVKRNDGWDGLQAKYNLPHARPRGLDHSLAYRALADGTSHVADVYTTDGEIKQLGLRVLVDDKFYFPAYNAVVLYRADLETRAPGVVAALRRLEGKVATAAMSGLNAAVQTDKRPEGEVGVTFVNETLGLSLPVPQAGTSRWGRFWADFLQNTYEHLFLVIVSLTAAVLVSIPLGVVAYKVPSVGAVVLGVVSVVQTLPALALLVFLLPLFSLGAGTAIAALFLYSLLPIVRNTYTGLKTIPPGLKESAEVLGLPWYARLWRVELPLASPSILAGIKIAAVVNVGTATIGALIGAGGYGQPILTGIRLYDVGLILQGAVPAAVLALLTQAFFGLLENVLVPKGLRLEMAR